MGLEPNAKDHQAARGWNGFRARVESLHFAVQAPLFLSVAGAILGLGITIMLMIGQCLAIGPRDAVALYGTTWLKIVPVAFAAGAVVGIGSVLAMGMFAGGWIAVSWAVKTFRIPARLTKVLGWVVPLIVVGWLIASASYRDTRKQYEEVASAPVPSVASARSSLAKQQASLAQLSSDAQKVIGDLSESEQNIRAARADLQRTLLAVEEQQRSVNTAAVTLRALNSRQAILQSQLADIQRALSGREPLTRQDLAESQRNGWIQGLFLGVVGSLIAAYLARWLGPSRLGRWWRKPPAA